MSNTGRNKKLASFNCDEELWTGFMRRCQEKGTTATATLTRLLSLYLNGELDYLDTFQGKAGGKDEPLEERVKACVREYLDNYLVAYQGKNSELYSTVISLSEKIKSVEERLNTTKRRTNTNTKETNPPQEREYWFIKERAKHLRLTISANQIIHIELFASDAYKQRYGELPKRQLLKNTYAFAIPVADVDILDAAIKKVTKQP
ncbi:MULTISPECIES: hypothetical protein [Cyanophyceae]|uniref:hypothetical protein n=1 Tax=Cyanophyceae TaxID=3028117 RepID=UPI0016888968|nr:hypothetical protein [Trichocoleus sp. FACHB-69]MBD1935602.1 hypothetical protein [Trichocoleus sp. FACHB-69]